MINLRETLGLYSLAQVHTIFRPERMSDSAGSEVTQQLMGAETSGLEIGQKDIPGATDYDIIYFLTVFIKREQVI